MKYFICKPTSHKLDKNVTDGIKKMDSAALFVRSLKDADICVLQNGWKKSRTCVAAFRLAMELHIERKEGCIYTEKYKAKTI